jgi:hypothetical protein
LGILLRMQRVSVAGNSGAGKTTIAAELARLIGAPHLELDSVFHVFHQPGWVPLPVPECRARVAQSIIAWAWTRHRVYRDRFLRAMIGPGYQLIFLAEYGRRTAGLAGPIFAGTVVAVIFASFVGSLTKQAGPRSRTLTSVEFGPAAPGQ